MDSQTAIVNGPRKVRQALALTLPLLAAIPIAAAVLGVYGAHVDAIASVQDRRVHLGRLEAALAAAESEFPSDADMAASGEDAYLGESSEAFVQAWFQRRLSQIADIHGMTVLSAANTPIVDRDGFARAGLRASLSGNNEALMAALHEIETSSPYLIVRSARISLRDGSASRDELMVEVQLEGLMPPTPVTGMQFAERDR